MSLPDGWPPGESTAALGVVAVCGAAGVDDALAAAHPMAATAAAELLLEAGAAAAVRRSSLYVSV